MRRFSSVLATQESILQNQIRSRVPRVMIADEIGEAAMTVVNSISSIFQLDKLSNTFIYNEIAKACSNLFHATWTEVLLVQDEEFVVLSQRQFSSKIEISEKSLPGYVYLKKTPQVINNAGSSSFYKGFQIQLQVLSPETYEPVQATSAAVVPIINQDNEIVAVIATYNKLNQQQGLSYFTLSDVHLIKAIGGMLVQVLRAQSYISQLNHRTFSLTQLEKEQQEILITSNKMLRRKFQAQQCASAVFNDQKLGKEVLKMIGEIMQADAVLLHINQGGRLVPGMAIGLQYSNQTEIQTRTSEYSAFTLKNIYNSKNLQSDPLWVRTNAIRMEFLLSCPIINNFQEVLGAVEFFRKDSQFNYLDEKIARTLLEALQVLPSENYRNLLHISGELPLLAIDQKVKSLQLFSANNDDLIDYVALIESSRKGISRLVPCDSCSVYLVDQNVRQLWTRVSELSSILTYNIDDKSLLSYTYQTNQTVRLPSAQAPPVNDLDSYAEAHGVVCIPVTSSLFKDKVIGVLLLMNFSDTFEQHEIATVSCYAQTLASALESLHFVTMRPLDIAECAVSDFFTPKFKRQNTLQLVNQNSSPKITSMRALSIPGRHIDLPMSVRSLINLHYIPQNKLYDIRILFSEFQQQPSHILRTLSEKLNKIIPCEQAKLFMLDETHEKLIDPVTENVHNISGLIKQCVETKEVIKYDSDARNVKGFDRHIDNLGSDRPIESYLAIPVAQIGLHICAVMVFVNSQVTFGEDDRAVAEFLSIIPREMANIKDDNLGNLQAVIKESRRHKMLQQ